MKKKIAVMLICVATIISTVGCSSSISNEYVSIKKYKGVEVEKATVTKVTDADVEENINSTLEAQGTTEEVKDRDKVEDGDTVDIDYVGKVDGKKFDGGSGNNPSLVIGSGQFVEGFEEGLIGKKVGSTSDIKVTFPEDYDEKLAGKDAVFTVTINKISVAKPAELTDEFVQSVSDSSKTVDEYKKEVKEQLEKTNKEESDSTLQSNAWQAVMDNTKVKKYDKDAVAELEQSYKDYYKQMATSYGVEYSELLTSYLGMSEEDFDKQVTEAAKEYAKEEQAIALIAKKEKLEPTDKEYEKAFEDMAKEYGYADVKTLKESASEEDLKKSVLSDIVKSWVAENAKQTKAASTSENTDASSDQGTATEDTSTESN